MNNPIENEINLKIKMKHLDGIIDLNSFWKIMDRVKNGEQVYLPDLKFKIVGYKCEVKHGTFNKGEIIIFPSKDLRLEDLIEKNKK